MKLIIQWDENEIMSLIARMGKDTETKSTYYPSVSRTIEDEVVINAEPTNKIEYSELGEFDKEIFWKKKTKPRRPWKQCTLLVDWQVFKKFMSVRTAAEFCKRSDVCLYNAAKVGSKVNKLYNVHIEWYNNSPASDISIL